MPPALCPVGSNGPWAGSDPTHIFAQDKPARQQQSQNFGAIRKIDQGARHLGEGNVHLHERAGVAETSVGASPAIPFQNPGG
mmetsp:Transcript_19885/g.33512  ORF Transcript_19885/g.33512 Transcript_19885/m.33512 type:complete len:82 (+) Transcript_19885:2532-2777(+)